MFKQLWSRLFHKPTIIESVPEPLSDDPWERSKQLSTPIYSLDLAELEVGHLDIDVEVCSDNIYELFAWLEVAIRCIETEGDVTEEWKLDQRRREPMGLVDYYFHDKTGYWSPQVVWIQLLEKIRIIHHLLDTKGINFIHNYHRYMHKHLTVVIKDAVNVMEVSLTLRSKS
jgi:hypothetical protein